MGLPDLVGWDLEGPDSFEGLATELEAMLGLPGDIFIRPSEFTLEELDSLRGVLLRAAITRTPTDEVEVDVLVAAPDRLLEFRRSGYASGCCIPGHIRIRLEDCALEVGRVKLDWRRRS